VRYSDDLDVRLAPFYNVVSTLTYIPDDVPALVLSFEWFSKAWWPREKVEEFCHTYGKLTRTDILRVFDQCFDAMDKGFQLARRLGKEVPRSSGFTASLIRLWEGRMGAFRD
jgi:hypothetical protein